jgi:putative selenate reductase molybdopterin-binding subunit
MHSLIHTRLVWGIAGLMAGALAPVAARIAHADAPAQVVKARLRTSTGQMRLLFAGTVMNPRQCRGQFEGVAAQAISWTLFEGMVFDGQGRMTSPTFRNYHIHSFVDAPRTEVHFADAYGTFGPSGAKPAGEGPFDPVAPALANALAGATGVRVHPLPFAPDRIYEAIGKRLALQGV